MNQSNPCSSATNVFAAATFVFELCAFVLLCAGMAAASSHAHMDLDVQDLASAWEKCSSVRSRFRRDISWLQFPIPAKVPTSTKPNHGKGKGKGADDASDDDSKLPDLHAPTTRAVELNYQILQAMLDCYQGEFVDIVFLRKEARHHTETPLFVSSTVGLCASSHYTNSLAPADQEAL